MKTYKTTASLLKCKAIQSKTQTVIFKADPLEHLFYKKLALIRP